MILEGLVGGKLKSLYGVLRFGAFFFFLRKYAVMEVFSQTFDIKKKLFWWQHEEYTGIGRN